MSAGSELGKAEHHRPIASERIATSERKSEAIMGQGWEAKGAIGRERVIIFKAELAVTESEAKM